MENLEQKSKSEDTCLKTEYKVEIEGLPQPYRAFIDVPYADLRQKFDEFYKAHEFEFLKKYPVKGKKSKNGKIKQAQKMLEGSVGVRTLYMDVLSDIIIENVENIMFLEGVNLLSFEPDKECKILAVYYYYPRLEIIHDVDYTCDTPVRQTEEQAWEDRKKELAFKHKIYKDWELDKIEPACDVLLDVIASSDGQPNDEVSFRGKWVIAENLPTALKDAIIAHRKGDLFELSYEVPKVGTDEKIKVDAHVKIHAVRELILPEIDDDLAQVEKFENLEHLRRQFSTEYEEYVERAKESVAFNHIIDQFMRCSKHPELPDSYLRVNTQQRIDQHIRQCGNDKDKAIAVTGSKTEDEMYRKFRFYTIQETYKLLVMREFAFLHNIASDDPVLVNEMVSAIDWRSHEEANMA
jgi:FKBP-type peptidyl-prolyl cis-trans isomerase (trigger factor)